jgi:hypothetical protein
MQRDDVIKLNEDTCLYEAPVAYLDDGNEYEWNEETVSWVQVVDSDGTRS